MAGSAFPRVALWGYLSHFSLCCRFSNPKTSAKKVKKGIPICTRKTKLNPDIVHKKYATDLGKFSGICRKSERKTGNLKQVRRKYQETEGTLRKTEKVRKDTFKRTESLRFLYLPWDQRVVSQRFWFYRYQFVAVQTKSGRDKHFGLFAWYFVREIDPYLATFCVHVREFEDVTCCQLVGTQWETKKI